MVEASLVSFAELGVLAVGIAIALFQLRDIKQTRETELETRQAQLFMQLYDRFYEKEFQRQWIDIAYNYKWVDYDEFIEKYGPETNPEISSTITSMMAFYEGVGVLVYENLVDISLVYKLLYPMPIRIWEKTEQMVQERRRIVKNPKMFQWLENLSNALKDYEKTSIMPKNKT